MTRHASYAFGFLIVMLMVAMGFAGIGPAQAQQDQPTQTPGALDQNQQGQAGGRFTLQTSDTLGSLLGRFTLTEEQVRQFLVANANLELDAGQTITFPAGVPMTGAGTGQTTATPGPTAAGGLVTTTPTTAAAGQATASPAAQTTATPAAGAAGAGQATSAPTAQTTATPAAGAAGTGGQTAGQTGFNCAAGQANPGQTYVTRENDTLGDLLIMMGLDVQAESGQGGQAGQSGQGGQTGQGAQATGTPAAGAGQATGTPAAGNQGQQGGQAGQVNTNQVIEFVYLNCGLRFDTDQAQTAVMPAGIPQTGGQASQVYTVQSGDTLIDIANRMGVTVEALLAANPNLLQPGQTINVPAQPGQAGQATPGATQQATQPGQAGQATPGVSPEATQQGAIPQTGQGTQQGTFAGQLRHPYADPGKLRHLAIYVVRGGDNLSNIARRFGTTVQDLQAMNPHILNPNLIFSGQWILVHPGEQVVINPPNWQMTGLNQNQNQNQNDGE